MDKVREAHAKYQEAYRRHRVYNGCFWVVVGFLILVVMFVWCQSSEGQ